ncbi:MAG: phosphomannomutase [Methylotenera sp. 24-45-7]|jgi:phosphomannomutase|nr:MAG: phosphomannomutase [Methylotenera sp. 24-45-7]OZA53129.1 MAG: phosphomannomutase [Methylophilales bacterium 39-45-7]HQS38264.1 phosphomannomutase [Methylotenera sp.]HQS44492.1 phosphomannomutase [Methylotenera sp.]
MTIKKINIDTLMTSSGVKFGTSGVRGLVEKMSNEVCYAYTTAFLQEVVAKSALIENVNGTDEPSSIGKVILGHDLRPSSPYIASICAAAIQHAGGKVVYAGALPTPALAYYAQLEHAPAIVVTGSHIPFDRNGIKFYSHQGEITKADELAIQHAIVDMPNSLPNYTLPAADKDVEAQYIKRYVDFFANAGLKGLRVAIYEHSSVARDLLRAIFEALGVEVLSLGRTDAFVPIDTEAVRPEDIIQAANWAQDYIFDAIVSTDGDADRPLIGDEHGQWLRGDVVGILCAKYLAANAVVTPVSSNTLTEKSTWFEQVIRTQIGSPYVIAAMQQAANDTKGLVVGFEANGGVLVGNDSMQAGKKLTALATRDAVLPILAVLAMAQQRACKVSGLLKSLPSRYTYSDRLQNCPTLQSTQLLNLLQHQAQQAQLMMAPDAGQIVATDITDGLRLSFSNGDIVHLRPSGNAPELRCYAESDTQENAKFLCTQCLARVAAALGL